MVNEVSSTMSKEISDFILKSLMGQYGNQFTQGENGYSEFIISTASPEYKKMKAYASGVYVTYCYFNRIAF